MLVPSSQLRPGLLATLFLLFLLLEPGLSSELERTARFYKGTLTTSRVKYKPMQQHPRRQLLKDPEPVQAFVVGYEPTEEDAVAAKLASMSKESSVVIMQYIPDDHWVVKARLNDIEALLAAFPNVTVSTLPGWAKASEGVDSLLESLHEKLLVASSASDRPGWLDKMKGKGEGKGLELHTTADGQVQVVIALQATPFVSMGTAARGEVNLTAAALEAAAWAADLAAQLRSHLRTPDADPCAPTVEPAWVFGAASVRVCTIHAPQAADWLLVQPSVVWVDLQKALNKSDFHANIAVQDGAVREALTGETNLDASNYLGLAKYWAKGLTGAGQVSGVTDTGMDMDACHLWDPAFVDYRTSNVNSIMGDKLEFQQFKSSEHRKVDAYFFFGNKVDDSNHGTHVASTLAGSAWNPTTQQPFDPLTNPDYATGIAPSARLSFFDIETSKDASEGFLSLPNGIEMFHAMYRQGVKVISNSWGGDTGSYSSTCTLYDAYTWFLQDLTLIAASGNEGLSGLEGKGITQDDLRRGTVSVPGSCKNIMSVGAAENWSGPWRGSDNGVALLSSDNQQVNPPRDFFRRVSKRDGRPVEYAVVFKAYDDNGTERGSYMLRVGDGIASWPRQGSLKGLDGQEIEVARAGASPSTACEDLNPSNYTQGLMLVFTQTSNCSALAQANNIINNGSSPIGGIMIDAEMNLGSVPDLDLDDNSRVFAYIKGSNRPLEMLDRTDLTTKMKVFKVSPQENIATFSSFGALRFQDPEIQRTQDLRTQPTVVAPGYSLSSNGNGFTGRMDSCEVTTLQGSSMATPVVAGTATIMRQYFMDGYYPSGAGIHA
ncbi:peptidase S8/S53 domain-containing protein [Dunaliella salina]|uniref:Peptidase S8/S53 domain-containing protein n=1 Tax=Dunaliella salina TaxID=3046 RepID=A0ABQ7H6Y5_DUNSA|nr:peptidase S8/S53 domain-containing protein [Dunaliella salina]|eukprot:KAF5842619.1 peptidase S8/S53 domain-containing protein [Dunaliella salina]